MAGAKLFGKFFYPVSSLFSLRYGKSLIFGPPQKQAENGAYSAGLVVFNHLD
jgi:hypothetical protein